MFEDSRTYAAPRIIIADETGRRALGESVLSLLTVVEPDSVAALDKSESCLTPNPQVQDVARNSIAYVILTSGSTGRPKGVLIGHRGVVNLAQIHTKFCRIKQDSRVISWAPWSFDASVWDIVLTPFIWRLVVFDCRLDPPRQGQKFDCTVINDFGPTELTVTATTWRCPPGFQGGIVYIPTDRPVIHSWIYLLDKHGRPVQLGAIGEMHVEGIRVARGYLNRPEFTADVFLPDPYFGDMGARMYKTEDLARVVQIIASYLERQGEQMPTSGCLWITWEMHFQAVQDRTLKGSNQCVENFTRLNWNHTSAKCRSGIILFRAMIQTDPSKQPISPDAWEPHVMGEIEVFDVGRTYAEMDQPAPLAEIERVLAQRLNVIHTTEAKEP
ncbi:MAG: hypothetical protein J3Q66DRAFT_407878 [Benniella sp.]|nr:MAG: hypothetical protein J3Q66DRAFT_407878 [Benniella sp.]